MGKRKKRRLSKFLRNKYRFIVYNDTKLKRIWQIRLSGWLYLAVVIPLIFIFIAFIFLTIVYTPIRNFIPGYPDSKTRKNIISNAKRVDSLRLTVDLWEKYIDGVETLSTGKIKENTSYTDFPDSLLNTDLTQYALSEEDSILRVSVEAYEKNRLSVEKQSNWAEKNLFFPPIKGKIVRPFDISSKSLGVEIETTEGAIVAATLDGTIILSSWTLENGLVLQIQHDNNLISTYKGLYSALKTQGERVSAGEAIAVMEKNKNKEHSKAFIFELWLNGLPINPTLYISF